MCLIGKNRIYPPTEHSLMGEQIKQFICNRQTCAVVARDKEDGFNHNDHSVCRGASSELPENVMETASGIWMPGFQPREKIEQTRNCAALPRDFVDGVVLNVANLLLNAVPAGSCSNTRGGNNNTWNQGGEIVFLALLHCLLLLLVGDVFSDEFMVVNLASEIDFRKCCEQCVGTVRLRPEPMITS